MSCDQELEQTEWSEIYGPSYTDRSILQYMICNVFAVINDWVIPGDNEVRTYAFNNDTAVWNGMINHVQNTVDWLIGRYDPWITDVSNWLNNKINSEASNRQAADNFLDNKINQGLQNVATNAQQAIDAEAATREANDNGIVDWINNTLNGISTDITNRLNEQGQKIDDVIDAAGVFLDDPIGTSVAILEVIFLTILFEHLADVFNPDGEPLPPKSDYVQLVNEILGIS